MNYGILPATMAARQRGISPRALRITVAGAGEIYCADALILLRSLRSGSADIVFLDPPFNLQKRYGQAGPNGDLTRTGKYFRYMCEVLHEAARVLAPGGALYLYHLPRWAMLIGSQLALKLDFRHWIAVSMKNGFVRGQRLYPAHYALLFFTKGAPNSFTRPKTPIQLCRHCGKPVKDYGGYRRFVAKGVNVSDIWDDFSPVRHRKRKHRKANELPLPLLKRVLTVSGRHGGLLVDPFVGTGPSLVAAIHARMRFIASDRERSACKVAARRARQALKGLRSAQNG